MESLPRSQYQRMLEVITSQQQTKLNMLTYFIC